MNFTDKMHKMELRVACASVLAGLTELGARFVGIHYGWQSAHLLGYLGFGLIAYGVWHMILIKQQYKISLGGSD